MNQKLITKEIIISKNDIIEHFDTSIFIINPKMICYNDKIILLRNVNNLLTCECVKVSTAVFSISDKFVESLYKILFCTSILLILLNIQAPLGAKIDGITIQAVVWFNTLNFAMVSNILVIITSAVFLTLLYSFYERTYKKTAKIHYFGLLIETKIGQSEGLFVQDKKFIALLFEHISKAINEEEFIELTANFKTSEIRYIDNKTHQISDLMMNNNALIYH